MLCATASERHPVTALYEVPVEPPVVSEPPAAELRSVSKWYGANRVLDEVSLRVKRGEIVLEPVAP